MDYLAISSQTCLFQAARILSLCLLIERPRYRISFLVASPCLSSFSSVLHPLSFTFDIPQLPSFVLGFSLFSILVFMPSAFDILYSESTRHIFVRRPFREPPSNIKSRFYVFVFGSYGGIIFVSWRSSSQFWFSKVCCHHIESPLYASPHVSLFPLRLLHPLSSVLRLPSSVFRPLSSVFYFPSSVFSPPSSVFRLPSSVLRSLAASPIILCCFVVFRFTSVLLCLRFGLESLLSLEVQQLDITIFELRFLSFLSTGSADLALKGRILSRALRPERHTYIFSLAPFSSFPSYQLAIILRPSFPSSPSQPA